MSRVALNVFVTATLKSGHSRINTSSRSVHILLSATAAPSLFGARAFFLPGFFTFHGHSVLLQLIPSADRAKACCLAASVTVFPYQPIFCLRAKPRRDLQRVSKQRQRSRAAARPKPKAEGEIREL